MHARARRRRGDARARWARTVGGGRDDDAPGGDERATDDASARDVSTRSGKDEVDQHLKGPRKCTDILFLLIFIAFWIAMLVLGFYGVGTGNPKILLFGTDYRGEVCDSGNNTGYKTRYFVNPGELAWAANVYPGQTPSATRKYNLRDAKSICLAECPQPKMTAGSVAWVCDYPSTVSIASQPNYNKTQWVADNYDYYQHLSDAQKATSIHWKGPCYPVLYESVNTFYTCQLYGNGDSDGETTANNIAVTVSGTTYRYESPFGASYAIGNLGTYTKLIGDEIDKALSGPLATVERYIDDFTTGWKVVVVAGAVCPIVLSIAFLFFLRYFTAVFAYTTLFCVNALAIVVTIYLYLKAGVIGSDQVTAYVSKVSDGASASITNYADPAASGQDTLKIFAYIATAITCVIFLFTLLMFRRIKVAIGVIKVATSALGKMPTLTLFPIVPAFFMVCLFIYWLITLVFLFSAGDVKQQACTLTSGEPPYMFCASPSTTPTADCHCGYATVWDRNLQGALAYYVFGFLWGSQWIVAMCYLVVACVFVQYYFKGGDYSALKNKPIVTATKKMMWYHSGTAAVGSFFVAILQFIRLIVRFVLHRMKKLSKDSKIVKYVGYYVEYCLWYLQKAIEWLNRNAYIMTAIEGTSFCKSAWNALALMVKNVMAVAAVNIVGDIMLTLGKLVVALGSGTIAFLMLDADTFNYGDEKVSSPLFIVIVVILFAFIIANVFMSIVELGVDTILLCYCKDCDDNNGAPLNAPPALVKTLGMSKKVNKMKAEEAAGRDERAGQ